MPVVTPMDTGMSIWSTNTVRTRAIASTARRALSGYVAVGTPHKAINTQPLSSTKNCRMNPPASASISWQARK